jgi:undecaprenyl-diphosphatase
VFYWASEAADYSRSWHAIGVTMAVLDRSLFPHTIRLAAALGVESALVNGLLKSVFPRDRPELLEDRRFEVRRPKTRSFPSGHASSACMTAVLLSDALPRLRPLWWILAALVASSRVHNRMHHPTDVIAGAALGTALGRFTLRVAPVN